MAPSSISINIGGLKTPSGALKLFQTVLGSISLGLLLDDQGVKGATDTQDEAFVYVVTVAFLITTFLLLVSTVMFSTEAGMIQKTVFEFLYHLFAFVLCLSSSINFLVSVSNSNWRDEDSQRLAIGSLVLINSILYLLSTYISYKACGSS